MRFSFIIFVFITVATHGQDIEKTRSALIAVDTEELAKAYLASDTAIHGEIFVLNALVDTTEFGKSLLELPAGDLVEFKSDDQKTHYFYKSLDVKSITSFRVQYIFLDNHKFSVRKIDSLRAIIMNRLKKGDSFDLLAKTYSMDGNSKNGGDLGWFPEGVMDATFEKNVRGHAVGDIFKIDMPDQKWYYVVKNTHAPVIARRAILIYVEVTGVD